MHRIRPLGRQKTRFLVVFSAILLAGACNTRAVGVNECRDVEYARCEASASCGVIEEDEVEDCKRFYRDQCLHGMTGDQLPTRDEADACLELILEHGELAAQGLGGADACDVVAEPWNEPECAYLIKKTKTDEKDKK